ncbi:MAG: hypothetical protein S0880_11210 [Actinomycetota bacterium]|nr:hypothetical protein [Actinomycetota bacterium]
MTAPDEPLEVGDLAADLTLVGTDGEPWAIEGHRGRPVLLVFHRHVH